jgi:hypothetical protein
MVGKRPWFGQRSTTAKTLASNPSQEDFARRLRPQPRAIKASPAASALSRPRHGVPAGHTRRWSLASEMTAASYLPLPMSPVGKISLLAIQANDVSNAWRL